MRFRPILLTLALVLLVHGTAFADGGNIMGDTYVDGQPASGICVDVLDGSNVVASQQSGPPDGDYNIYVATPGWYTVRFSDCGVGYTSTQFSNAQIVSDQDVFGVNAYLSSAGRVAGNLKDNLAAVITGACVRAEDQYGTPLGETTTDGNGNYVLGGLPTGQTKIRFEGCSAGNFVAGTQTADVDAGQTTTGIDAVLARAGTIAGHIQNANGEPLQSICVSGTAGDVELSGAITDSNGNYEIRGVPPTGSYDIRALDCYGLTYIEADATGPVAGTGTATVDFTLPRPGFITGHVRDEAGAGLASICVTATREGDGDKAVARTDRNGYYELNRVRPGTWDLSFNTATAAGAESACDANDDWSSATTMDVVLADGDTLWDVDTTLKHADPPPADPAGGAGPGTGAGGAGGGSGSDGAGAGPTPGGGDGSGAEASGAGGSGPGGSTAHPAGCKAPKLVGLSLAKAKKRIRAAHCKLGKVTRKRSRRHVRRGSILRQRQAGSKVAVTVTK